MNRYFLSLTLLQGAVIGWVVAMGIKTLIAMTALKVHIIGLITAYTFVATELCLTNENR